MSLPVALVATTIETTSGCPATQEAAIQVECRCAGVTFAVALMVVRCKPDDPDEPLQVVGPCWVDPDTGALHEIDGMLEERDHNRLSAVAMGAAWKWVCSVMRWPAPHV